MRFINTLRNTIALKFAVVFAFATVLACLWMQRAMATHHPKGVVWPTQALWAIGYGMWVGTTVAFPYLVCWCCGIVVLVRSTPRSPISRIASQPGFAACFAVASLTLLFFFCGLLRVVVKVAVGRAMAWNRFTVILFAYQISDYAGQFVAILWLLFLLARIWRPSSSPLETLARILGVLLIFTWSLDRLGSFLMSVGVDLVVESDRIQKGVT